MHQILNNESVRTFLHHFPEPQHQQTLKDLVLIGINTVLARLTQQLKKEDIVRTIRQLTNNEERRDIRVKEKQTGLEGELIEIKTEIGQINERLRQYSKEGGRDGRDGKIGGGGGREQERERVGKHKENNKSFGITPKVTEVYPQFQHSRHYSTVRLGRHHLDDRQLKQIFNYQQQKHPNPKNTIPTSTNKPPTLNPQPPPPSMPNQRICSLKQLKTVSSKDQIITIERSKSKSPEMQNPKYQNVESKIKDLVRHDKEEAAERMKRSQEMKRREMRSDRSYNVSAHNPETHNRKLNQQQQQQQQETTKKKQQENNIKKSNFFSENKKLTTFMVQSQSFGDSEKFNSAIHNLKESSASSISEFSAFSANANQIAQNFKQVGKISRKRRHQ